MPYCGCEVAGVSEKWLKHVELVKRLSVDGRVCQPHDPKKQMKSCNKDVSHNHELVAPLLECMAEHPSWELFSIERAEKELLVGSWYYYCVSKYILASQHQSGPVPKFTLRRLRV